MGVISVRTDDSTALRRAAEVVGLTVLCGEINLGVSLALVLAARRCGVVISAYLAADPTLLVLSLLEALVLLAWADAARS